MNERTTLILSLVCCAINLCGWITAIMAEENRNQYWPGLAMLTISMFVLTGMLIAEMG